MRKKFFIATGLISVLMIGLVGCGTANKTIEGDSTSVSKSIDKSGKVIGRSSSEGKDISENGNSLPEDKSNVGTSKNIGISIPENLSNPFGSINGAELSVIGNDFSETFGADGFTLDKSNDSVGVSCQNSKYEDFFIILKPFNYYKILIFYYYNFFSRIRQEIF